MGTLAVQIIESLMDEQQAARLLLKQYEAIGPAGFSGRQMVTKALQESNEALLSGDLDRMLLTKKRLKECQG